MLELQRFVDAYPPGSGVQKADDGLITRYSGLVPDSLLALWQNVGFGSYGGGLVQIVNPDAWRSLLHRWLLLEEDDPTRIPIAISAFGRVFYYRRLSDEGDEDVCSLDPHRSDLDVIVWSLNEFFNDFLCEPACANDSLQVPAFQAAVTRHGPLDDGQMFTYVPALRLGGSESTERLEKEDAFVHLEFLLQLALSNRGHGT